MPVPDVPMTNLSNNLSLSHFSHSSFLRIFSRRFFYIFVTSLERMRIRICIELIRSVWDFAVYTENDISNFAINLAFRNATNLISAPRRVHTTTIRVFCTIISADLINIDFDVPMCRILSRFTTEEKRVFSKPYQLNG